MFSANKYFGVLYTDAGSTAQSLVNNTSEYLAWASQYPSVMAPRGTVRDPTTDESITVQWAGVYRISLFLKFTLSVATNIRISFATYDGTSDTTIAYGCSEEIKCAEAAPVPYVVNMSCIAPLLKDAEVRVIITAIGANTAITVAYGNFTIQGVGPTPAD